MRLPARDGYDSVSHSEMLYGARRSATGDLVAILSDWELWAVANETLKQHGENASIFAAMRADELLEDGDRDGVKNWLLVIDRIEQLLSRPEGPLN